MPMCSCIFILSSMALKMLVLVSPWLLLNV